MAAPPELNCVVTERKMITDTVLELWFEPSQRFEFEAGQFISIVIPGAGPKGRDLRRAYSIASSPEEFPMGLSIKEVKEGPGTTYLFSLKPGDTFKAFAPYGKFVYKTAQEKHACFIATGTGIAPFRSMILSKDYQERRPRSGIVLFGARTRSEVLYEHLLRTQPGVKWVSCLSRENPDQLGDSFSGRVTNYMRNHFAADFPWTNTEYYLCGSGDMITEVKELLAEKGVDKEAIHLEKYY